MDVVGKPDDDCIVVPEVGDAVFVSFGHIKIILTVHTVNLTVIYAHSLCSACGETESEQRQYYKDSDLLSHVLYLFLIIPLAAFVCKIKD